MTDPFNEPWDMKRPDSMLRGDLRYVVEYGPVRGVNQDRRSIMSDSRYHSCAPDIDTAAYVVELHNLALQHGGLDTVRRKLIELDRLAEN